jgi:hypothetical protein
VVANAPAVRGCSGQTNGTEYARIR